MTVSELISGAAAVVRADLIAAATFPFDANKRIYLVYVLGALVLATVVYVRHHGKHSANSFGAWRRYLFNSRIWWHRSARLDYQLLVFNPLIQSLFAGLGVISVVAVAVWMSDQLDHWVGAARPELPAWAVAGLFTTALFVADDFTRYALHRLMHRVPCLWALHKLHHSAEVLTPVTVYRIHPVESLLYATRMALTQGLVLGIFFYGFGMRLSAWEVAGANVFTYVFNLAGSNLRHSHIPLSYGRWVERLFISPAQHQVHHSRKPEHFDRNFGSCLAIWDGLFGSLTLAQRQPLQFGLGPNVRSPHTNLWRAYQVPVVEAWQATGFNRLFRKTLVFIRLKPSVKPLKPHVQ